jgi:hypothetical protein
MNIQYPFTVVGVFLGVLFGFLLSIYNGSDGIVIGISAGLAIGYGVDKLLKIRRLKEIDEE